MCSIIYVEHKSDDLARNAFVKGIVTLAELIVCAGNGLTWSGMRPEHAPANKVVAYGIPNPSLTGEGFRSEGQRPLTISPFLQGNRPLKSVCRREDELKNQWVPREREEAMPDPSHYLLEMARRCAQVYATFPQAEAIMVTGSVAESRADFYSDIDMCVYYHELPLVAELTQARKELGGGDRIWGLGDVGAGAFAEAYPLAGVECQVVHATLAAWERDMDTVLVQLDAASPLQKALSGMQTCIPLYGDTLIQLWKERAAAYPDRLAVAMVERNLTFFPVWSMPERFVGRDTALWLHEILVEAEYSIVGVLAGINRLYFSRFQFKGMDTFIRKMQIAPADLSARLKSLLSAEAPIAIEQLKELVLELTELVEAQMPEIDTSQVRQQLAKRRTEWTIL